MQRNQRQQHQSGVAVANPQAPSFVRPTPTKVSAIQTMVPSSAAAPSVVGMVGAPMQQPPQQYGHPQQPQQHHNHNHHHHHSHELQSTTGMALDLTSNMEVYNATMDSLLIIPRADILQLPRPEDAPANLKNLQLCPCFDADKPDTSCPSGSRCRYVHARTAGAETHDIHVNYAWASLDDCVYERLPAGQLLQVAPPNAHVAGDEIPSHLVLKTRALQSNRRVISHCAHYYFNRACNRGPSCMFIHAVSMMPASAVTSAANEQPTPAETPAASDPTRRVWGRTQQRRSLAELAALHHQQSAAVQARVAEQQQQPPVAATKTVEQKAVAPTQSTNNSNKNSRRGSKGAEELRKDLPEATSQPQQQQTKNIKIPLPASGSDNTMGYDPRFYNQQQQHQQHQGAYWNQPPQQQQQHWGGYQQQQQQYYGGYNQQQQQQPPFYNGNNAQQQQYNFYYQQQHQQPQQCAVPPQPHSSYSSGVPTPYGNSAFATPQQSSHPLGVAPPQLGVTQTPPEPPFGGHQRQSSSALHQAMSGANTPSLARNNLGGSTSRLISGAATPSGRNSPHDGDSNGGGSSNGSLENTAVKPPNTPPQGQMQQQQQRSNPSTPTSPTRLRQNNPYSMTRPVVRTTSSQDLSAQQ